jgi:hypothetical protein
MNPDAPLRDVYAEHGVAMGEAQLLEQYLRHFILAVTVPIGSGRFDADALALSQQSLGALIQVFARAVHCDPSFRDRLDAARRLRNWLAHSYFADRSDYLRTVNGRAELIRELDQISEEFYQLWGYFDAAIVEWLAEPHPMEIALISKLAALVGDN